MWAHITRRDQSGPDQARPGARAPSAFRCRRAIAGVAVAAAFGAGSAASPLASAPLALTDQMSSPASDPLDGPRMGETGLVLDVPSGVPAPPAFPAGCFVLADLDTGAVILAKCPHSKGLPASTMKALTALALADEFSPQEAVTAIQEDANQEGSKVGLTAGSAYTIEQLFQGLLLTSGNDAAWALARHRGLPETIKLMNDKAAYLGAHDTLARNPSGLDAQDQVSSAYDLALIGRAVLRNERLAGYVKTLRARFPRARVPGGGQRGSYEISNHNRLLTNYPGTIGLKNGYTAKARSTYIGAARRADSGYLITYLNNPIGDWRRSAALLDWAFAYGKQVRAVGTLVEPGAPGAPEDLDATAGSALGQIGNVAAGSAPADAAAPKGHAVLDWFLEHGDRVLCAGGALAVLGAGFVISARARRDG